MSISKKNFDLLKMSLDVLKLTDDYTKESLEDAYENAKKKNNIIDKEEIKVIEDAYNYLKQHLYNKIQREKIINGYTPSPTIFDKFQLDIALCMMEKRIATKIADKKGIKGVIERKEVLRKILRDYDLNDKTKIEYFTLWNEYRALKTYVDYDNISVKKKSK